MTSFDPAADAALPARRRNELLRLARTRGQVTVTELSGLFGVSADTIRRDLDFLEGRGLLARTHGGAVPVDVLVGRDAPYAQRMNTQIDAKRRIARAAANLIGDGETLIVNGGSTTRLFAAELTGRRDLTIVTNNLELPLAVPAQAVRDIYVLGGQFRRESHVTIGPLGFAGAGGITADTAVLGVGGLSASAGLSTTLLEEAGLIAAMMAAARRTMILADASKFGHASFAHIAPLDRAHVLVTDQPPPQEIAELLERAQVDVVVAG
ncbi:DeoR/GlpR family DNA-binding transcription regulator [Inquilinus limosus]|uniref:DeoR/GlpR family DNA-binding transcription regulator n=1 Tax=Inquilinus limosus TaxID=171674 RepID=UPI003F14DDC4